MSYVCFTRLKAFILYECGVLSIGKLNADLSPFCLKLQKPNLAAYGCVFSAKLGTGENSENNESILREFKSDHFCSLGQWPFQCQFYRTMFRILLDFLAGVAVSTTV